MSPSTVERFRFPAATAWLRTGHHNQLVSSSLGTIMLRGCAMGLSFVVSLLLARILGVTQYGAYAFALGIVNFLAILAVLGLNRLIVRDVAVYRSQGRWELIAGLIRWSSMVVAVFSTTLVVIGCALAAFVGASSDSFLWTVITALLLLPVTALTSIRSATLRGLSYVTASQFYEYIVNRGGIVLLLLLCPFIFPGGLESGPAMALRVLASWFTLIAITVFTKRKLPQQLHHCQRRYEVQTWMASGWSILMLNLFYLFNGPVDLVILGFLADPRDVAVYDIAFRTSALIALIPTCITTCIAPELAKLHGLQQTEKIQQVVTFSARAIFVSSAVGAIILSLGSPWFFNLYGPDFSESQTVFFILTGGTLINVFMGPVNAIMVVTRREKVAAYIVGISGLVNVGLNFLLVPFFGAMGAAMATAVSSASLNLILMLYALYWLKINTTAIGYSGATS